MRLVPVLWYEISLKNTRPKYIGRQNVRAGTVSIM